MWWLRSQGLTGSDYVVCWRKPALQKVLPANPWDKKYVLHKHVCTRTRRRCPKSQMSFLEILIVFVCEVNTKSDVFNQGNVSWSLGGQRWLTCCCCEFRTLGPVFLTFRCKDSMMEIRSFLESRGKCLASVMKPSPLGLLPWFVTLSLRSGCFVRHVRWPAVNMLGHFLPPEDLT